MVSKTVFALVEDSITYCKNISFRTPLLSLKRRPKISRCYVERGMTETDLHFYVIIIIIEYIYLIATESQLDRLVVRGQPQYGHIFLIYLPHYGDPLIFSVPNNCSNSRLAPSTKMLHYVNEHNG